MNRRRFLHATAASLACSRAIADEPLSRLGAHRLQAIELKRVPLPWSREVGKNSKLDRHGRGPTLTVAVLKTDQGGHLRVVEPVAFADVDPARVLRSKRSGHMSKPGAHAFTISSSTWLTMSSLKSAVLRHEAR